MKIAIMQPYVFPYIGYFQLINAVDTFVFYDDVNFIKKGFINRNFILVDGKNHPFTIPCKSISQNRVIKDTLLFLDTKFKLKWLKTIEQAYGKAPFFNDVYPLLKNFIINNASKNIAEFAIASVIMVTEYLSIKKHWVISSESHIESQGLLKEKRLIEICKKENAQVYINSIGGKEMYNKNDFKIAGIELCFLKGNEITYNQYNLEFIPNLSIIDILMFNSVEKLNQLLTNYELV